MKILNVAKAALYGIFLNYYCYYVLYGAFIPRGTMIFFAIAFVCVGLDVISERYVYIGTEFKCWIAYAVLSFLTTGFLMLGNSSAGYIGDIAKYVQRLIMTMMIAYICEREKSIRFGLQLMAVTAAVCAVSILLVTDDIQRKLSISTDASLSANDIGAIMAFGCFSVIFSTGNRNRPSFLRTAVKTAAVIAILSVVFLAGSRKSFGAIVIMAVLLAGLWFTDYRKKHSPYQLLIILVVGAAAYLFITENLLPLAEQTNLYNRLIGRGAEGASQSDDLRVDLYRWAIQDFLTHPFFGLGFNEYVSHHGNYTHSTYVEPLACSGLIGLLYLYPYASMTIKQIQLILKNKKGSQARLKQKEILVYLCMFLFIAVGIPYMYKDVPCILLGTFVASQAISFQELREVGHSSETY